MRRILGFGLFSLVVVSSAWVAETVYQPTWESLDARPCPAWFGDAKFGIFIHWGVYSVPAWGPKGSYSEWYWKYLNDPDSETQKYHYRTYGEKFKYQDFAPQFKAELFDPDQWAEIFAKSGAKYIVLTSKHHEGFCLWPNPQSWNWNSVDIGAHRDLLGDLTNSVRARGLHMGVYYSFYEWYHPLYLNDKPRFVAEHMIPQFKDLVLKYRPDLIFTDGEWEDPDTLWKSRELLTWLFNESPCRDYVVVNDRWGKDTRGRHGGYYTTEYGNGYGGDQRGVGHVWEECRGIGASFGYNRNEEITDYQSAKDIIHLLVEIVSNGGNLLLDIGPTGDGRIPVIMQERLLQIGEWLQVNGEAVYGTKPWRIAAEGKSIRYTSKDKTIYAFCLEWPGETLTLSIPKTAEKPVVTLLGYNRTLSCRWVGDQLQISVPQLPPDQFPCRYAYGFKINFLP